jgi:hypothetical protein
MSVMTALGAAQAGCGHAFGASTSCAQLSQLSVDEDFCAGSPFTVPVIRLQRSARGHGKY